MDVNELKQLKESLELNKQALQQEKGKLSQLMENIKAQGFKDLKALEKGIDELDSKKAKLEQEFNDKTDELEELLDKVDLTLEDL